MASARHGSLADPIEMQNRLFAELSRMFGREVPLYDKALLVNGACNRAVCDLLAVMHPGFAVTDAQLEKTSGERHGAIRIGRPDEYRWVGRFFGCFGMHPHNFYDMTSVGAKSQPVIATAFRSLVHPEHRVFTSLLRTDYFDGPTRARIEARLSKREVFSARAKQLIEKCERDGGLSWADAEALIGEATGRIFKWTGRASDLGLYKELCDGGFKIAADIACFERHHLNHLTPNTFSIDLYTSAMKHCLGELDEPAFRARAVAALRRVEREGDSDYVRLHFKHLTREAIDGFGRATEGELAGVVERLVGELVGRLHGAGLTAAGLAAAGLKHAGFKDTTEGPAAGTPVLLRQDAYKALTERVVFVGDDGGEVESTHTARFGEIEQRFYATTPAGRELYDRCLASAEAERERDPGLVKRDWAAAEAAYARHFEPMPKTLTELVVKGLVYARCEATEAGLAARGTIDTTDTAELHRRGFVVFEGLRYEDFLPVSAAGIFASNLSQYGTKSTAAVKPTYTRAMLEEILGREIVDADVVYRGLQAESLLRTYRALGVEGLLTARCRAELEAEASACPAEAVEGFSERSVLAARA